MFRLTRFLKPYKSRILLILVFLLGSAMADLYLPGLMADIVNLGVAKSDIAYIFHTGTLMLTVACAGIICSLISSFTSSRVALAFARSLRLDIFKRVESFSFNEFDKIGTASLITDYERCNSSPTLACSYAWNTGASANYGSRRNNYGFHARQETITCISFCSSGADIGTFFNRFIWHATIQASARKT